MTARDRPKKTLKEVFGPASQSEMYLARALEEFHRAGNPPDLWVPVDALHRGSLLEGAQAGLTARSRRLQFLRTTVLFAALAAEAFANELFDELLPTADAKAIDRLPTPEKLLVGTKMATGASPLERGAEPMQSLQTLFATRNRLVHPRPQGGLAAWVRDIEQRDEAAIGPDAARRVLLCVVDTVVLCNPLRKHPTLHAGIARTIDRHRHFLLRHQERCGPSILDIPAPDEPSTAPLMDQMMQAVAAAAAAGREGPTR
jgi:hypothetical protein